MFQTYLHSINSFFGPNETSQIPFTLSLRNQNIYGLAIAGLTLSFIILAATRITSHNLISTFGKVITKNNTISKIIKEDYSLSSFSSILLIFNYFLTSSVLLYLCFIHLNLKHQAESFIFLLLMPL